MEFVEIANPFPGLRPFELEESNLFFGREGQSDALLERLRRTRFLAVVGTSGSGKSSLIRAGLLPALYGGLMGQAGSSWRLALFRPGHDPLGNLAAALNSTEVYGAVQEEEPEMRAAIIETTLRRSTLGLVDAVRQARMQAHENLLVVVDQFEELFRFKGAAVEHQTEDDAAAFVKLLLEAAGQREVPVYVVLTMRSDFLGDCAQFWGLPEAINAGQYLIPRMTRDERREAVTGPIAVGGGHISLPLVNRLLNDMGDNPDHLPIMQHALMRTWDYWTANRRGDDEPLDLKHYEAVGGMHDALSRHADQAYEELLDERSRKIAEKLFKALTEKGADNREIRRPTPLRVLCEIAEAPEPEVVAVIDIFRRAGRSFLMPPAAAHLDGETIVDISHESLIRNWERLKAWVDEEAQAARVYRRLAEAAVLHREGREALLNDPALQFALDWREQHHPNQAWGVRYHPAYETAIAFLDESRAARDAQLEAAAREREESAARERRELEQAQAFAAEQARAARRLRVLLAAFAVMFVLALVAFVSAYVSARRADAAAERAEAATRRVQLNRQAQNLIQSYEMERAERQLSQLYSLSANDEEGREGKAWVLYQFGELNRKLERNDQAASFFESALEHEIIVHGKLGLDSIGTLDSLSHTLEAEGNYPQAITRYEQLLDILNGILHEKDRYFRLNTANVNSDLANLYLKQADAEIRAGTGDQRGLLEATREKALRQYMLALAIWEDVLRDDPEALVVKYKEADDFLWRLGMFAGLSARTNDYNDKVAELRAKQNTLLRQLNKPLNKKPIGALNPGNDANVNTVLPPEGAGYTTPNRDAEGTGRFGRPATVNAIREIAATWASRHPDIKFVVGDISHRGGGPFPPHPDHQDGREVDIWALTNNGASEPTNIYAPNYSRELTAELVRLIKEKYPNSIVYFDDPKLVAGGLAQGTADHDNYLHVLFP